MIFVLLFFLIVVIHKIDFIETAGCTTIKSKTLGNLFIGKNEKNPEECLGSMTFEREKDGKKYCLKKGGKKKESLECTPCKCGQENVPEAQNRIVEGGIVSPHQFPWHAALVAVSPTNSWHYCGGSLISNKVVLTAAHCEGSHIAEDEERMVGLGLITQTKPETNPGYFKKVKSWVVHNKYDVPLNDIALYILENPVVFTRSVRPVCLPDKLDLKDLERSKNILPGFGTRNTWLIEYERLLGGKQKLNRTKLFTKENIARLISETEYPKEFVTDFFRTFFKLFPGIESCYDNDEFDLECWPSNNITTRNEINEKMRIDLENSNNENEEIEDFLEKTHIVLETYVDAIENMKKQRKRKDKIDEGLMGEIFKILPPEYTEEEKRKIRNNLNSDILDQLIFMKTILKPASNLAMKFPSKDKQLRKASGEFTSWDKWSGLDFAAQYAIDAKKEKTGRILVKKNKMKDGFGCSGDSGGGVVVKKDGRYVVVAVASSIPDTSLSEFPPTCICNCEDLPEIHTKVSEFTKWIKDEREKIGDALCI